MVEEVRTAEAPEPKGAASKASRVLNVLLAFSEYRLDASVKELAEVVDVPVPTAYRYVGLLKELHVLEEGPAGRYHPTAKVMPVARAAQLSNGIGRIAAPIIAKTAAELGESVLLMQTFGDSAVCIEGTESTQRMRFTVERGHSIPLGVGATGKMALAALPEADREVRLEELGADTRVRTEVADAARLQFATSEGEVDAGTWACSVPVVVVDQRPIVLTLAGPAPRLPASKRELTIESLRKSAQLIYDRWQEFVF